MANFAGGPVTVGTAATVILPLGSHASVIENNSAVTVFVGGSDVNTTDKGFPLGPGKSLPVDVIGFRAELYGVVASGTAVLDRLRLVVGS